MYLTSNQYLKKTIVLFLCILLHSCNTNIASSQENILIKVQVDVGGSWARPLGMKSLRNAKQLASLLPSAERLITLEEKTSDTLYNYIAKRIEKIKNEKELGVYPIHVRTICVFKWKYGVADTLYLGPSPFMVLNNKYYYLDFWLLHRICNRLPESDVKYSILNFISEHDLPEELKKKLNP